MRNAIVFKKLTATVVLTGFALTAFSQRNVPIAYPTGTPVNYVRTWDVVAPLTAVDINTLTISTGLQTARITTQYMDGLGRPLQTVAKQGSLTTATNTATDAVSAAEYDAFGREQFTYLPFASTANNGLFKSDPFQQQAVFSAAQYPGESHFYGQTQFEASPLNRVEKTLAPGNSWMGNGKGVSAKYWINTALDDVKIWTVTNGSNLGDFGTYTTTAAYAAGELYKSVTADEHDKQVIEFKDKEGKVILKKVQLAGSSDNGTGSGYTNSLCTYYIYDDLNQLRCVIQPRGVELLADPATANWSLSYLSSVLLNEQCFRYEYDQRGRMIVKKVPGAAPVQMVYDARDRLVMTQDGNMNQAPQKWLVTKYDELNRPTATYLWTNSTLASTHRTAAAPSTSYPTLTGAYEELTQTFYDNYAWVSTNGGQSFSSSMNSSFSAHYLAASTSLYPYAETPAQRSSTLKGMVTGSKVKVLGSSPEKFLYTISYYDEKGRLVQSQSQNLSGGVDIATTQYSFSGQVLLTVMRHQKVGPNPKDYKVITKMTYDDLGRVTKTEKKLDNETIYKKVSTLEYDALGQLKKKKLAPDFDGGVGLETLTYDYNIRGWTLGVNRNDLTSNGSSPTKFAFELGYDKQTNASGRSYSASQYNGNITGMVWKSAGDGIRRKYDYSYDASNRLLQGLFEQHNEGGTWGNGEVNFNVKMGDGSSPSSAYDANGNIKQMQQWGLKGVGSTQIDNLTYKYDVNGGSTEVSNKLYKVTDLHNDPGTKLGDFKDGANSGDDYAYDVNGNLTTDNNKAISSIVYNHLNLPQTITITGKGSIDYVYDAAGNKLKKIVHETGQPDKTTLYLFGTYQDDELQFLPMEEGRIRFEKATTTTCPPLPDRFIYDYMLKDHLGNVRMVLTEQQENKCYPGATVEDSRYQTEDDVYDIQDGRRVAKSATGATQASFEDKLYRTDGGSTIEKTGLGTVLKVMSGDKVRIYAESFYTLPPGGIGSPLNMIVGDFLSVFTGSNLLSATKGAVSNSQVEGLGTNFTQLQSFITRTPQSNQAKAYLNWVLFDEQLKVVGVGADPVNTVDPVTGESYTMHSTFINSPVNVTKNGYLYVFVSNESNLPVYFDNLTLTHIPGPILEETHYYPFGLAMSGISSKSAGGVENKYKFNGIEQNNDFDLNMYDAHYRNLDPQLGRFWQIDPKPNENFSPYAAMANNPLLYSDPFGDTTWLYNQRGVYVGTVNDNLANQTHFLNLDGDPGTPLDLSGLSAEQVNAYGASFRKLSVAFMGSNTAADMQAITAAATVDGNNKEVMFTGSVGKDKEIRLTAVKTDKGEYARIDDVDKILDQKYTKAQQAGMFLFGHVHPQKPSSGGTIQIGGGTNPLYEYTRPSSPTSDGSGDYGPYLYRSATATQRGQSPALVLSRWGFTVYGTASSSGPNPYGGYNVKGEVRPGAESYYLYKQLKK